MAGVEIGTAWVSLAVSAKGITRQVEQELRPVGDEAEKASKKAGEGFDAIGTKALIAAAAGGAALFKLASAAGDLEAAIAANEQVLGDASEAVQEFARNGVENVGLSEEAVLNAGTAFGQLGKIMGLTGDELSTFSTDMVTLAADLAAFANVPADQAVNDLRSAFAGSTETMQKYNVFLNETELKAALFRATGEEVTGTLNAQQRVLATHAALMEQTGDIQGQAAREADSFQRAIDNLKASVQNIAADFGAPIVGFAAALIGHVSDGLSDLAEWNEETGGMLATGVAAGIGIGAAAGAAVGVAAKVKKAVDAFKGLSTGVQVATGAVGALAIAVTAGFVIYGLMTKESREVAARTREVSGALDQATIDAWEYGDATNYAGGEVDGFAVAQRALSIALTTTGEDGEALVQALGAVGAQSSDAFSILFSVAQDAEAGMADLARQAGLTAEESLILAQAAVRVGDDWPLGGARAQGAIRELATEVGWTTEAVTQLVSENYDLFQGLEGVQNAAEGVDLDVLAEQFLNSAVAASSSAEELVNEAKARASANDVADSSVDTYNELMAMLGEMAPAERQVALEALGLAQAQSEVEASTKGVNTVAATTIDMMSDAEEAFENAAEQADAFRAALDRLVGGELALQAARDELQAGYDELAEVIEKATKGEEGFSLSLANTTEEGRNNREMIRDNVENILSLSEALLENGASTENASAALRGQRQDLINLIRPFFETEQAAEDYINMLGLTPEAIDTAVRLAGDEAAKQRIEELQEKLGDIPEEVKTAVEAAIDRGDLAEAERLLNQVARERTATIRARILNYGRTPGSVGIVQQANADGGYSSRPTVSLWGEDGPEWIAPLSKPDLMRKWLEDSRIRGPVMAALDLEPQLVGVGAGRSAPLVDTMNVFESTGSSVEEQLNRVMFRAKVGA